MSAIAPTLRRSLFSLQLIAWLAMGFSACGPSHEHIAPAVYDSDSLPFMTSHGISNLISDSGIISYKIVAEDWDIYTTHPPKWTFLKGLFLEKFDPTYHVQWHVQCDTAYCHDNRIWELRGRVVILNREGTLFKSEELFWDMNEHQMWSTMFMSIHKPESDQALEGYNFRSNEEMTDYHITNSSGYTPASEADNGSADASAADAETTETSTSEPNQPFRRSEADYRRQGGGGIRDSQKN